MGILSNAMLLGGGAKPFISTWKTDNAGSSGSNQISIPTVSTGSYNCVVDWGDGSTSTITTYNDAAWTHTYSSAGTYIVKISGIFSTIRFNNAVDRLKLLNISQWGIFRFGANQNSQFYGCANLTITAVDVPNTSEVTNFTSTFRSCTALTSIPNINNWNMLSVTTINNMFSFCSALNQSHYFTLPIVTTLQNMYQSCTSLNSALTFVTSSLLTTLGNMMNGCSIYNSTLLITNTTGVTSYSGFLSNMAAYNQPVTWISTAAATSLNGMFTNASSFNQDISHFIIANVASAVSMLSGSSFSITNYNLLLDSATGWPSQATIKPNVNFNAGSAKYSGANAIAGRAVLTGTYTWTITDGGLL